MSAPPLAPAKEVLYTLADVSAELQASTSEVYLVFDVKNQAGGKAKTSVLGANGRPTAGGKIELSVKEPVNAIMEVRAYSKTTLLPDHTLGDFKVPIPQPGTSQALAGTLLSKTGDKIGSVHFAISSGQASAPTTATQSLPSTAGARLPSTSAMAAPPGRERTAERARAEVNQVGQKAAAKTDATALTAKGKTVDTVNAVEQKLRNFKSDLAHGSSHSQPSAAQQASPAAGGQSAYSQAVGVPPEVGTTSDAYGSGLASSVPHDATSGGPIGVTVGPIPTLQTPPGVAGSTTSGNAEAGFGGKMRAAAIAAADKAEQALEAAKSRFVGNTPTATRAPK